MAAPADLPPSNPVKRLVFRRRVRMFALIDKKIRIRFPITGMSRLVSMLASGNIHRPSCHIANGFLLVPLRINITSCFEYQDSQSALAEFLGRNSPIRARPHDDRIVGGRCCLNIHSPRLLANPDTRLQLPSLKKSRGWRTGNRDRPFVFCWPAELSIQHKSYWESYGSSLLNVLRLACPFKIRTGSICAC